MCEEAAVRASSPEFASRHPSPMLASDDANARAEALPSSSDHNDFAARSFCLQPRSVEEESYQLAAALTRSLQHRSGHPGRSTPPARRQSRAPKRKRREETSGRAPGSQRPRPRGRASALTTAHLGGALFWQPATSAISHAEAAAAAQARASALSAAALAEAAHSDDEARGERCLINGCREMLLRCRGGKEVGTSTESDHVLCKPCLERWYASQKELRGMRGLAPLARRQCPVCTRELRAAANSARSKPSQFEMGLEKLMHTWPRHDVGN